MNMNKFLLLISGLGILAYFPVMTMIMFSLHNVPETNLFYKPLIIAMAIGFFSFFPLCLTFFCSIDVEESQESD